MYRYLKRLRELHPNLKSGYIDWMTEQVAKTFDEDPLEMKAALLGYSHDHPHTNVLLRGISELGCGGGDAGIPAVHNEHFAEEHALDDPTEDTERFSIRQTFTNDEIVFTVMDGETAFTDFGISHEKEMHLLLVRDDLRHFFHVHPSRDADGTWRLPFTAPPGGRYLVYADFVDLQTHHHTLRFEKTYQGETGSVGFEKNTSTTKTVGDLTVTLESMPYSQGTLFTLHIRDQYGNPPLLQPYLGTMGHGILVSKGGDFVHTHPSPAGDGLTFNVSTLKDDIYRIFAQFQVQDEVYTVTFDWEPEKH